jgi:hypothetical protein
MNKSANQRVQRWRIQLNNFDCVVVRRKGKTNVIADWLSRCSGEEIRESGIESGKTNWEQVGEDQ